MRYALACSFVVAAIGLAAPADSAVFTWHDQPGQYAELKYGDRPVLRYMYAAFDNTSPQTREATFKVFHELYSPDGARLVTKGVGGEFTHHRGLFYGFMKTTYGKDTVDIWHCKKDTHQAHAGFLGKEEGPVLGRQRVAIDWNGTKKQTFAIPRCRQAVVRCALLVASSLMLS